MRMRTTHYLLLLGFLFLTFGPITAQTDTEAKATTVAAKSEDKLLDLKDRPVILGLPNFVMNTSTSLRTEPDHRSKVQIRLRPGMKVEVLDPHHYHYWTKVRVGTRIGWAKKHCMDPLSGELDYSRILTPAQKEL